MVLFIYVSGPVNSWLRVDDVDSQTLKMSAPDQMWFYCDLCWLADLVQMFELMRKPWDDPMRLTGATNPPRNQKSRSDYFVFMTDFVALFFFHHWFSVRRFGAWEVWQPDGVVRGAHQVGAQHVALPVLHRAGQCQGLHRVHWAWELRPLHD